MIGSHSVAITDSERTEARRTLSEEAKESITNEREIGEPKDARCREYGVDAGGPS